MNSNPAEYSTAELKNEINKLSDKCFQLAQFIADNGKSLPQHENAMLHAELKAMYLLHSVMCSRSATMMGASDGRLRGLAFASAIDLLQGGFCVRRLSWDNPDLVVVKQIPACIGESVIPNMQSLPDQAKELIMNGKRRIHYWSQCLIYNIKTGVAHSWAPSTEDVFAGDWELILPNNNPTNEK